MNREELEIKIAEKKNTIRIVQNTHNRLCDEMIVCKRAEQKHQKILEDLVAQLCELDEIEGLRDG